MPASVGIMAWLLAASLGGATIPHRVSLPFAPVYEQVSAQGNVLMAVRWDMRVALIDLQSDKVLLTLDAHDASSGALSADGRRFAIATRSGRVIVYGVRDGSRTSWAITAPSGRMQFLRNGMLLVAGRLWNVGTRHAVARLRTRFGPVTSAALSPDGRHLAAGGGDTVLRVYDAHSWVPVHRFSGLKLEVLGVAYTRDGSRIVTGGIGDRLAVLDASSAKLVKTLPTGKTGVAGVRSAGVPDWMAVQYIDPRTDKPVAWRLVDVATGRTRPLCGPAIMASPRDGAIWCYRVNGKTLLETPHAMP